jgi:hypothetical protein
MTWDINCETHIYYESNGQAHCYQELYMVWDILEWPGILSVSTTYGLGEDDKVYLNC